MYKKRKNKIKDEWIFIDEITDSSIEEEYDILVKNNDNKPTKFYVLSKDRSYGCAIVIDHSNNVLIYYEDDKYNYRLTEYEKYLLELSMRHTNDLQKILRIWENTSKEYFSFRRKAKYYHNDYRDILDFRNMCSKEIWDVSRQSHRDIAESLSSFTNSKGEEFKIVQLAYDSFPPKMFVVNKAKGCCLLMEDARYYDEYNPNLSYRLSEDDINSMMKEFSDIRHISKDYNPKIWEIFCNHWNFNNYEFEYSIPENIRKNIPDYTKLLKE